MQIKQIPDRLRSLLSALPKPHKPSKTNLFLLIVSFAAAVMIWAFLVPDATPHYSDISVSADLSGTKAEDYGLQLLPESEAMLKEMKVVCDIKGNRTAIGGFKRSNLVAYVDFDDVTNASGEQTLRLWLGTTAGKAVKSDMVDVTLQPDTVKVNLDYYTSKTVPVSSINRPNITLPDPETFINDEGVTVDPATVIVRGPSTKLDQIDHVSLTLGDEAVLRETETFENVTECTLMDNRDRAIDNKLGYFEVQEPHFTVTIPVYYQCSKAATGTISDIPAEESEFRQFICERIRLQTADGSYKLPEYGEDDETLKILIRTDDPKRKENLDVDKYFDIFNIQLSALSVDKPLHQDINLPEGYTNVKDIAEVWIALDAPDLEKRVYWVRNSDVDLLRKRPDFNYQPDMPGGTTAVTLIGPPEELDKIQTEDLKLSADMLSITDPEVGIKKVQIDVGFPANVSKVWVSADITASGERVMPSIDIYMTEAKP